jgi:hypothetical protein
MDIPPDLRGIEPVISGRKPGKVELFPVNWEAT